MTLKNITAIIFCTLALVTQAAAQADSLLPATLLSPGAVLNLISNRFTFTEGPAADRSGNIFFTDQPNDNIWEYDLTGRLTKYLQGTERSNGLYFGRAGQLVACADQDGRLVAFGPGKRKTILLTGFHGKKFNGPNDCWVAPGGATYFTDPFYPRDYRNPQQQTQESESVYYLLPGKKSAMVADSTLKKPNGIVGTPDGHYLYVADIGDNKTYRYRITESGSLSDRQLFVNQGSDGMTIDEQGNVYLTGNGVTVYDAAGRKLGHIPVPAKWTANICFGGGDRKTLFITASENIFTLAMSVKGTR